MDGDPKRGGARNGFTGRCREFARVLLCCSMVF